MNGNDASSNVAQLISRVDLASEELEGRRLALTNENVVPVKIFKV